MQKRRGFTLVELLVVIAIIGLLSALAVVSLGNIREKGRDTKRLSDMEALRTAMQLIESEYGSYDVDLGCDVDEAIVTCGGEGSRLEEFLPTVKNMMDPMAIKEAEVCSLNCPTNCDYSFKVLDPDTYSVAFRLEAGAGQYRAPGCYLMTNEGIEKIGN